MDLNKIKTFVKVAEIGNISTASTELFLTQQAVSQQILNLEEELEFKLFQRSKNRILLTKEGQLLYEEAQFRIREIEEVVLGIRGELQAITCTLRIGVSFESGRKLLPGVLSHFKKYYPSVKFEIYFESDLSIEQKLLAKQLDFGMVVTHKEKKLFQATAFLKDTYVLAAHQSYIDRFGPFKQYKNLIGKPMIDANQSNHCLGVWVKKNCPELTKSLLSRRPDIVADDGEFNYEMIASGQVMGFIPEGHLKRKKKIISLFPKSKPIQTEFDILALRKKNMNKIETLFFDYVVECVG